MKNLSTKAKPKIMYSRQSKDLAEAVFPERTAVPGKRLPGYAAAMIITLCFACACSSVNSVLSGMTKLKTFNFTTLANDMAKYHANEYFHSRKFLSLQPTGGRIVWEDFYLKQKHVATYSGNSRYVLYGDAGGAMGLPMTRTFFPLLYTNSGSKCHYFIEIFDGPYYGGFEQELVIYNSDHDELYWSAKQKGRIYSIDINLPRRNINNQNLIRVVRTKANREGNDYYLVTRVEFLKDFVVASGNKKLMKIHGGSYITFQSRSFFRTYRGVFTN